MNKISLQNKATKSTNVRMLTMTAMLAAVSYVLSYFDFQVPLSPSFARMDLSDFPALIGAFAFSSITGLTIEVIKNLLQLISTSTGGIGELANFIMGGSFVFAAGLIYRYKKTKTGAMVSCIIASIKYRDGNHSGYHELLRASSHV